MTAFRKANAEEKEYILDSLKDIRSGKRLHIFGRAAGFAFIVVLFAVLFWSAAMAINKNSAKIPKFESKRDALLHQVYHYESHFGEGKFVLNQELSEIDFDHPVSYTPPMSDPTNFYTVYYQGEINATNADQYDEVVARIKDYYDEKYAEENQTLKKKNEKATFYFIVAMVLTIGSAGLIIIVVWRNTKKELEQIQNDQFVIAERQVFGVFRDYHHSRSYTYEHFFFDVEDGEGGTERIQVSESEYGRYQAPATAYLIKPDGKYCMYDEYEVVLKK